MLKRKGKLMLCILMTFVMILIGSYPSIADWRLVPQGWITDQQGYFGSLDDGRDTLSAIQTYRFLSEKWSSAYESQNKLFMTNLNETKTQLSELERQINSERKAWSTEVKRNRSNNFILMLVVVGVGALAASR